MTRSHEWSDEELRELIKTEFAWNALVEPSQLDVSVVDGVATIFGTVSSVAEKLIALEAADAVYGVRDVVSEIEVKVHPSKEHLDSELEEMVRTVLDWDALVPEQSIDVRVVDGWVTLSGQTPTARQSEEAERATKNLIGVRGVSNLIVLQPVELPIDAIHAVIEQALRRRASRAADHIDVTVDGHRVTLSGTVQSPHEKRALVGVVGHLTGVEAICDALVIDSHEPTLI